MSGQSVALTLLCAISCPLAFAGPGPTLQITGTYLGYSGSPTTPFQGSNFTLTLTMPSDLPQSVGQAGYSPVYSWTGGIQYSDNGTTVTPTGATALLIFNSNPCVCTYPGGFELFLSNVYVPGDGFEFILGGPNLYVPNAATPLILPGSYTFGGYTSTQYNVGSNIGSASLAGVTLTISAPAGTIPSITSIYPNAEVVGGPAFTMTVSGSGFLSGATVLWNGSPLSTIYSSPLGLYALVPANLIASQGGASVTVLDPGGATSNAAMFTIRGPVTITTSPQLPAGTVGSFYSQSLTASGGLNTPYFWSLLSGALPSGLSLSNSGTITGTPTAAGTLSFTVRVTDTIGFSSATQTFSLTVSSGLTISTSTTLPLGNVGTVYAQTLTASGGVTPYVWSLVSGALPEGLSLSSAGMVTGTPSAQGTVSFTVKVKDAASASATQAFSLTIGAPTGPIFIGSMAHIAAEENWTTTFTLVNKGTASAQAQLSFFGDPSDPSGNGPLTLPLVFPQQPPVPQPLPTASLDQTISANASLIVETAGPQTSPVQVGSAQLAATGAVDGFAIFHLVPSAQEAVVPLETRNASSYLLGFDNTNGVALAVAVANVSEQAVSIGIVIRDDTGAQIGTPGATITLPASGHTSFVLTDPVLGFPVTVNKRGTIEFDTANSGQISVLGIRTTSLGSGAALTHTLTTIPALANVGIGGGSFPFLASGGDGWQTTFALVNTGSSAASATLSFLDLNGNPLPLPLSYPQSGNGTTTVASSVTQTLAAGATLVLLSAGAPTLLTGSAQLSTGGNVSGFAIFRYNPTGQEAVVPLESRNASAYLLAFDNTNGTATGIAVNTVSSGSQQVYIPVVIRDDSGNLLAQYALPVAANGDFSGDLAQPSAALGNILFPETANIRGTLEFDAPLGVQLGVIGVRTPAAHTYTTLPALVK